MLDRAALMSIHPVYANAIVDGRKRVEFRKRGLAPDIRRVLVYATTPLKHVIGEFSVERIVKASPAEIWEQYGSVGVISYEDYHRYFVGSATAVAIIVERPVRFPEPVELRAMSPRPAVPQSFSYVHGRALSQSA